MTGGFINANQAWNNYTTLSVAHTEISLIEQVIMNASNNGGRAVTIDFTGITSKYLPPFYEVIEVDTVTNRFTAINEVFCCGESVMFTGGENPLPSWLDDETEYCVTDICRDSFSVAVNGEIVKIEGQLTNRLFIRKVLESEQYYKAWRYYYLYPCADKYLLVVNYVEDHFRKLGYSITKYENKETKTFYWKIRW